LLHFKKYLNITCEHPQGTKSLRQGYIREGLSSAKSRVIALHSKNEHRVPYAIYIYIK